MLCHAMPCHATYQTNFCVTHSTSHSALAHRVKLGTENSLECASLALRRYPSVARRRRRQRALARRSAAQAWATELSGWQRTLRFCRRQHLSFY